MVRVAARSSGGSGSVTRAGTSRPCMSARRRPPMCPTTPARGWSSLIQKGRIRKGTRESAAMRAARDIFESRGNAPRVCRNAVVFLAADEKALGDLLQATAHFLALKEVDDGWVALNLDASQKSHAETKRREFDRTVDLRIGQTWIHALCPTQAAPSDPVKWEEVKATGNDALAQRTSDKLRTDELLVRALGVVRLKMELDRVPLGAVITCRCASCSTTGRGTSTCHA